MKKITLALTLLLLTGLLMPSLISAQPTSTEPDRCYIGIEVKKGKIALVDFKTAEVLITPSGNLQLKATFDLRSFVKSGYLDIKHNGTTKITAASIFVQVYSGMIPEPPPVPKKEIEKEMKELIEKEPIDKKKPYYIFTDKNVNVFVDPDGIGSVVHNWNASEMIK